MSPSLRRKILFMLLVITLLIGVVYSWQSYRESARLLKTASVETAKCRQLADALMRLRQSEGAPIPDMPEDELYERIHQAAQQAGLNDGQAVQSIHPQPAHPVRGSSFEQKEVELSLSGLTMEQLVRFLDGLHLANPQLQIAAITLREPKGSGVRALWNADPVVVRYRIDAPAVAARNMPSNP